MATLNFEVQYDQPENTAVDGTITFIYEGDAGEIKNSRPASGRIDSVGEQITSVGSFPVTLSGADFDVVIECTRTSANRMDVELTFFGNVFAGADNPTFTGYGYGYGYGAAQSGNKVLQTII